MSTRVQRPAFTSVGVLGAGTMGTGIAYVAARSGATVWLVEPDPARHAGSAAAMRARSDAGPELLARVRRCAGPAELPSGLDAIVEAVPEDAELKREVLAAAETRHPRLLGSNTSTIPIHTLAVGLSRPERLIGLHFFNPVWAMPLLEVVRQPTTPAATVAAALELAAQLGKDPIVVADVAGFATSRLGLALGLEAMRMLEDQVASAEDIDRAMMLGYRHPMGPLRLTDLIGLDVRLAAARTLEDALGERFRPPQILLDHVQRGELGRKTGRGFFDWPAGPGAG